MPQVITGMGGVGKTQIAVEHAYRHAGAFELVWWTRAEDATTLAADYQALANRLQLPVKTGADGQVFAKVTRYWLEATTRHWLMVYDNAEEPAQLSGLLPQQGNGQILITSRNPDWRAQGLVLPMVLPFETGEAREFLLKRTGRTGEAAADRLAELLGRLPLALEQAAATIGQSGMSLDTYAGLFQAQRQELWQREKPPAEYGATVSTTWELAFRQVSGKSAAAAALLNVCAFLAAEGIPLSLFGKWKNNVPAELASAAREPLELEDTAAWLYRYSVVSRPGDDLSVHRLIQNVVRDRLGETAVNGWMTQAANLVDDAFVYDFNKMETWTESARLLPHALAVVTQARQMGLAIAPVAALWQKMGDYQRRTGDFALARKSVEQALSIRPGLFGERDERAADSVNYLGELLQEQGDLAGALSHFQMALSALRERPVPDDGRTALALNDIGAVLEAQGQYEPARPYYEEALAIRKKVLGEHHPDTATSLHNLGRLLHDQGQYEQAGPYYEEALAIKRKFLGEQHPDTATCLTSLGALLQEQGQYEQARPYYEEALATMRKALGEQHPDTAVSLNNLGGLLFIQGKPVEAAIYLKGALQIFEKTLGPKHPRLVSSLSNMAQVMMAESRFEPARLYMTRAMAICAHTNEKFVECQKVRQLLKQLPGPIGKAKKKK